MAVDPLTVDSESQAAERSQPALQASYSVRCGQREHRNNVLRLSRGVNALCGCFCLPRAGLALVTCYAALDWLQMHCHWAQQVGNAPHR